MHISSVYLTDTPYRAAGWRKRELYDMARQISSYGPSKVVVTGIPQGVDPSVIAHHRIHDHQRTFLREITEKSFHDINLLRRSQKAFLSGSAVLPGADGDSVQSYGVSALLH